MTIELDGMIQKYRAAANDQQRAALDQKIRERYNITAALMVLDMSGFSRITEARGIVHFLAMVQQMQEITSAELQRHDGKVIKFFSDNCFAYFADAQAAVECAVNIMRAHRELNRTLKHPVHICIGIDHGEFLLIEGSECFGHTVNRACKLGEDIAEREELLISTHTHAAMSDPGKFPMQARSFEESGLSIEAFLVDHEA
jgi:adenylate cyclase